MALDPLSILAAILFLPILAIEMVREFYFPKKGPLESDTPTPAANMTVEESDKYSGAKGTTRTPLRPVGTVEIDREQHTARTQGEFIDAGQPVVVLRWAAGELIVEAVRESE